MKILLIINSNNHNNNIIIGIINTITFENNGPIDWPEAVHIRTQFAGARQPDSVLLTVSLSTLIKSSTSSQIHPKPSPPILFVNIFPFPPFRATNHLNHCCARLLWTNGARIDPIWLVVRLCWCRCLATSNRIVHFSPNSFYLSSFFYLFFFVSSISLSTHSNDSIDVDSSYVRMNEWIR